VLLRISSLRVCDLRAAARASTDGDVSRSVVRRALPVTSLGRLRSTVRQCTRRRPSRRSSSGPFHVVRTRSPFIQTGSRSESSSPGVSSRKHVTTIAHRNRRRAIRTSASSINRQAAPLSGHNGLGHIALLRGVRWPRGHRSFCTVRAVYIIPNVWSAITYSYRSIHA